MIRIILLLLSKCYEKITNKEPINNVISNLEKDIKDWNSIYGSLCCCDHCGSTDLELINIYITDVGDVCYKCKNCGNTQQDGEPKNQKTIEKEIKKLNIAKEYVLGKYLYRYQIPQEKIIIGFLILIKLLLVVFMIVMIKHIITNK